ncbi:hypothetical protein J5N97_017324 [Dioscorea zingiberensis]|uniref:Elongation factor Ts, mitochondrial n=1 Tax=Dioscorea zingiberensis TaxID=325984 RepID=A0A9D5CLV3_9LILI|nr:hypothetical protein J5N97_017324 [Dioscorea zingiberensis]
MLNHSVGPSPSRARTPSSIPLAPKDKKGECGATDCRHTYRYNRTTIVPGKEIQLSRCHLAGKRIRVASPSRRFLLPQSSLQLFQIYGRSYRLKHGSRNQILAAVGADVTIEDPNSAASEEAEITEPPPVPIGTNDPAQGSAVATSKAKDKRPRPARKSEMPPVKNEELVPGASFVGKVRSVQPFGAFVDFGAFTDGLVHVSQMSEGYVKDVGALVSVGQEVKVRIVEVNMESGRISLTMRDGNDANKSQQRKDASTIGSSDKPKPNRRNASRSNQQRDDVQKTSKFVKGQVLDGTVKNQTRSGAFITLPEGEEGFLPISEESEGFDSILGNTSLQIGQEVNVKVLRISRGKITLTMKKEQDVELLNMQLNQGVDDVATNPFQLAFRKNKEIAAFLDEREKAQKASETSKPIGGSVDEVITKPDNLELVDSVKKSDSDEANIPSESDNGLKSEETISKELPEEASVVDSVPTDLDEEPASMPPESATAVLEDLLEKESSGNLIESSTTSPLNEISIPENEVKIDLEPAITSDQNPSSVLETLPVGNGNSTNLAEVPSDTVFDTTSVPDTISKEGVADVLKADGATETDISAVTAFEDEIVSENLPESKNGSSTDTITNEVPLTEEVILEEVNFSTVNGEVETEASVLLEDEINSSNSIGDKVDSSEASNEKSGISDQGSTSKGTISPALVKQLREETGAGMMDCKKALAETGGDIIKAQEFLQKKGLASADKKASRATAEGRIGSYIHDNRIGVLIEVNCETDFVSRGEIFKQLVDDLAMQVAACPQVKYLVTEDVPEEIVNKEREIEMQKEDLLAKPEQIRSKIVDGRIRKRLEELALLDQPYIKDDKVVVKDFVKQTIATIGENIKVRRFVRFNLGEGLERKSQDFAAEVAAQTAARSTSTAVPKDQPVESQETAVKPPTIAVSAALVKQLREETGAGMMDCKKALTETGGDLEKAQEYLRKKGLSSADKKSSRLAAEGRIASYIHDSRIGALIEVNCETDFVARNEKFKELVEDLAMQVVACPQVNFVSLEEIPENVVNKEKEIEMQREDLQSKPENIREKIVEGRISKRLGELTLLEQPFIKDDSILVKDLVKQTVAALGENVKVRRFVRFTLGENND